MKQYGLFYADHTITKISKAVFYLFYLVYSGVIWWIEQLSDYGRERRKEGPWDLDANDMSKMENAESSRSLKATIHRCSIKKLFWKISRNLQNTYVRVFFLKKVNANSIGATVSVPFISVFKYRCLNPFVRRLSYSTLILYKN